MASPDAAFAAAQRTLALHIGRRRAREGWTQQQAADAMGIDVKHLQKLEYGELNPSLKTLVRVSVAFGVPIGRLFVASRAMPTKRPVGRPPRSPSRS